MIRAAQSAHRALTELATDDALAARLPRARTALKHAPIHLFSPDFRNRLKECLDARGSLDDQSKLVVAVIYRLIYASGEHEGLIRSNA